MLQTVKKLVSKKENKHSAPADVEQNPYSSNYLL
jgi:hypothetical protein